MRLGADAMAAALEDFERLRYSTQLASLYESYLVARWLAVHGRYPQPSIDDVNEAVAALFVLYPDHDLGRLAPFRLDWRQVESSGRKTVWNNTTRGPRMATTVFNIGDRGGGDIREGLMANATEVLGNHLSNVARPSRQSLICLMLRDHDFVDTDDWATAESILAQEFGLRAADLALISDPRPLGPSLFGPSSWEEVPLPFDLAPPSSAQDIALSGDSTAEHREAPSIVINRRLERMLARAIARYPCILLVGPPGTGKGTILRWLVQQVTAEPNRFGFSGGLVPDPIWRTPDESWGVLELVGGQVPNSNGKLEWSDGLIPTSIREDRWLILDETNRADMDKIMGPLLTWLSGQAVEVGHTVPHNGTPIALDWTDGPRCKVEEATNSLSARRLLAGSEWRLLGTYNPQDAQLVFRFGQALTRRFAIVPVPALSPGEMEKLLSDRFSTVRTELLELVAGLYGMHYESPNTTLGPAIFLRVVEYMAGFDESAADEDAVAEAYVINVGRYLASYDNTEFENLGRRIRDATTLTNATWEWIRRQRGLLS